MASLGYLDIDQILMEEELVPVTFLVESNLYHKGSTHELPLWKAKSLAAENLVTIEKPKVRSFCLSLKITNLQHNKSCTAINL